MDNPIFTQPMKLIFFICFPFVLNAQAYELDSMRYTGSSHTDLFTYSYSTPVDFKIYHRDHYFQSGESDFDYREFKDSLLTKWTIATDEGDSIYWNYTYDDLDRLISELDFFEDTLSSEEYFTYLDDTDLLLTRERINYDEGDTSHHYQEWYEYEELLRPVYSAYRISNKDTLFRFIRSYTS